MRWIIWISAVFISMSIVEITSIESADFGAKSFAAREKDKSAAHWEGSRRRLQTQLSCYTCMSSNVPEASRATLSKTIKMDGLAAAIYACDDPFASEYSSTLPTEVCGTACIKITNENRDKSGPKFVVRGCFITPSNKTAETTADMERKFTDVCDRTTDLTGELIAELCICTKNDCNQGNDATVSEKLICITLGLLCISFLDVFRLWE